MAPLLALVLILASCVTNPWTIDSPTSIRLNGRIDEDAAALFFKTVRGETRVVVVNSSGGDAKAALEIGKYIFEQEMDVVVDGECMSSCANWLFLAGKGKTVLPNSWLGFHGGAAETVPNPEKFLDMYKLTPAQRADVRRQMQQILDAESAFYAVVAGRAIVRRSVILGDDPRIKAKVSATTYKKYVWLPTKVELEAAGVKEIGEFWFPSAEERLKESEERGGLRFATEDIENLGSFGLP